MFIVGSGSLLARIVFQPIEEVMRLYFSKTFAQEANVDSALKDVATALTSLVSIQLELSIFSLAFGTAYLPILLPILLPPIYGDERTSDSGCMGMVHSCVGCEWRIGRFCG